jgi:thiol:disulfide interchange protein
MRGESSTDAWRWNREAVSRIMNLHRSERSNWMRSGLVRNGMTAVVAAGALLMGAGSVLAGPVAMAQTSPIPRAHIYPDVQAAHADIQAALAKARREHKRVILDFGGDWCGDCQVLNIYFHQSPNAELLEKHFVLVDVNIGRMDQNLDIAHKYGVPVQGVPALAVLSADGKVIYSQNKEFADMRNMDPKSVTDFLNKWKQ